MQNNCLFKVFSDLKRKLVPWDDIKFVQTDEQLRRYHLAVGMDAGQLLIYLSKYYVSKPLHACF